MLDFYCVLQSAVSERVSCSLLTCSSPTGSVRLTHRAVHPYIINLLVYIGFRGKSYYTPRCSNIAERRFRSKKEKEKGKKSYCHYKYHFCPAYRYYLSSTSTRVHQPRLPIQGYIPTYYTGRGKASQHFRLAGWLAGPTRRICPTYLPLRRFCVSRGKVCPPEVYSSIHTSRI